MVGSPRVLAFAGSSRRGSFNQRLLRAAAQGARDAGAEVTEVDLGSLELPIYGGDLESVSGLPAGARSFKEALLAHDALLIAAPEYNSSITPLLKNAIDWASRPASKNEPPLACFRGKVAALVAASPGALGGLRGLRHVREILMNIQVTVIPDQIAVPKAHEAFAEDGSMSDAALAGKVAALGGTLARVASRLMPER